jgi:RNA polymerase sigma-70 factor (ECF subfamily)
MNQDFFQKDEEIVKKVLKNPDFYTEIISKYQDKIKRYICRISNIQEDDVDDLTQDVFLAAYENLNSFDTSLSFSA